jgi:lysophospholipase
MASNAGLATPLDVEAVRQALRRLDLAVYAPLRDAVADYVHFYGLDFEKTLPGVRHYAGWFDAYGYRLLGQVFMPPGIAAAKGTVFILHGYLDHSGLYGHLIRDSLTHGYAVFIYDLPGHGLSGGARMNIPDFSHYQFVLKEALAQFGSDLPWPFYGVGQSTGGAILMDYVLSERAEGHVPALQKVLLLAPLLRPAQWTRIRFGFWLIRHFQKAVPRIFRANSSDKDFLRFVQDEDPLQDRMVPMGWIGALRRWVHHMEQLPACDFPVLMVQGMRDETVEWPYNNRFVRRHFQVEHEVMLPEASHQLANERDDLRAPVHAALALMLASAPPAGA